MNESTVTAAPARLSADEVVAKVRRYYQLVKRERELKEFLVSLRLAGSRSNLTEKLRQHDEAIAEIRRLKIEEMVPLLGEIKAYVDAG